MSIERYTTEVYKNLPFRTQRARIGSLKKAGFSISQIGQLLGLSVGTVRSQLRKKTRASEDTRPLLPSELELMISFVGNPKFGSNTRYAKNIKYGKIGEN